MALIIFLFVLPSAVPITLGMVGTSLLPISHSAYWFVTDYIVLMLLSPFLNILIKKLSKSNYLKLMLILLIIWSIYPTFTGNSFGYSSMVWFIVLYLIGSFIKLHVNVDKINYNRLFLIFLISTLIIYAGSSIIGYLSILFDVGNLVNSENTFTNLYTFFASERNLFVLITSVSLFLLFLKRKEFSNKYINYIAGSVLGVYLIHDNVFIRPFLWKSLFNVSSYYYSSNLILIALFSIVTIFVICIGIDIIRRETIEKIWIWILDNKLNMFSNWTIDKFRLFGNLIKNYLKN